MTDNLKKETMRIEPLNISTMTVSGHLGAIPDLKKFYNTAHFIPYWWIGEGIIEIELNGLKKGQNSDSILHRTAKSKKSFNNQSTLVFRLERSPGHYKEVNIKLFINGGFQMTGISSEEMGRAALQRLISQNKDKGIWDAEPYIKTFSIHMWNSDYSINKAIRRDRLHQILVETYGLWSSFEPTIYQGVNTKFFWNATRPASSLPGICVCPVPCEGTGSGYAVGECKRITISPFRTGSIIITGAKDYRQLTDAYDFMNKVLLDHADYVLRDEPMADAVAPPKKITKTSTPPTTAEGIIRLKMRASPRNIVTIPAVR